MYDNRLRQIRERIGIPQKEVAKYLGLQNTTYCDYENGKQTIPLKHLIKACDYFNVSLDYIFEFTDNKKYQKMKKEYEPILVGKRLKEFRKTNKLTQVKLAEILNTTHSVIADYERGRYLISTSFLYTICKKYNISADYILGRIN